MVFNDIFIKVSMGIEPDKKEYDILKKTIKSKGAIKIQLFSLDIYSWIRIIDLVDQSQYLWKLEEEHLIRVK